MTLTPLRRRGTYEKVPTLKSLKEALAALPEAG